MTPWGERGLPESRQDRLAAGHAFRSAIYGQACLDGGFGRIEILLLKAWTDVNVDLS